MVVSGMVQVFSWAERWNVLFNVARGEVKLDRLFHLSPNENICPIARMKNIHYLFHITSKIFLVIRTHICCHLERLNNLNIFNILLWSRRFRSKVTAVYHYMQNCAITRYYLTMTSYAFNGLSPLYHVTLHHPIKWQESTWCCVINVI